MWIVNEENSQCLPVPYTHTGVGLELSLAFFCMANDFSCKIIVGLQRGTCNIHLNQALDSSTSCIYIETDFRKCQRPMAKFSCLPNPTYKTPLGSTPGLPEAGSQKLSPLCHKPWLPSLPRRASWWCVSCCGAWADSPYTACSFQQLT